MRFRRPLFLSFAQFATSIFIEIVGLVILARLLTPAEMGVFAAALAAVVFCRTVTEFGLYEYVINVGTDDAARRRSVVGLSAFVSAMGALLIALAVLLLPSSLFDASVAGTVSILALTVILHPWVILPTAALHRSMRIECTYIAKIASSLTFVAVAVALAVGGLGAASMAWGMAASTVAYAVVVNGFTRLDFLLRPSSRGWPAIARFCGTITATSGSTQFSESAIALMVGHIMGYGALGLFARARDLLRYLDRVAAEAVMPVLFPYIAHEAREGRQLATAYLLKIAHASAVCWPLAAFLALFAEPVVLILLGEQWRGTIPLVVILSAVVLVLPFNMALFNFAVALGLSRAYLKVQLLVHCARLLSVFVAARHSLVAVCGALVACEVLLTILNHRLFARRLTVTVGAMAGAARTSGIAFLAILLPALILHAALRGETAHDLPILAGAGLAMGLLWLFCVWRLDHPLKGELVRLAAQARRAVRTTS